MRRIYLMSLLLALTFVVPAFSQQTWMRAYGGTDYDWGISVKQTFDGGYIVAGSTMSFPPQDWNAYLIRTNGNGDTLWTRVFGDTNVNAGNAVVQTPDSAYVLAGTTSCNNSGSQVYLVRVLPQGDTLWTRTWFGSGPWEGASDIIRTRDGGLLLTGWSGSPGVYDVLLVKTDASGDTLWTKTYGGNQNAEGYSVCQTADSGFIVVGEIQRAKKEASLGVRPIPPWNVHDRRVPGLPFWNRMGKRLPLEDVPAQYDIYLLKTNASGDSLWSKFIGGTGDDIGEGVRQTSDGGYILVGHTTSFGAGSDDVYLVKTDSLGDTLWTRTYGGLSWDLGYDLDLTPDAGFILVGATSSFGDTSLIYLLKTDAQGNLRWSKTLGGPGQEWGYSVRITSDGGYIITGSTSSFGAGDVRLIKTDSLGNVGVEEKGSGRQRAVGSITSNPNPFVSFARVPGHEAERFSLYDVSGRKVGTYRGDRIGEGLVPGVYFLKYQEMLKQVQHDEIVRIVKVR